MLQVQKMWKAPRRPLVSNQYKEFKLKQVIIQEHQLWGSMKRCVCVWGLVLRPWWRVLFTARHSAPADPSSRTNYCPKAPDTDVCVCVSKRFYGDTLPSKRVQLVKCFIPSVEEVLLSSHFGGQWGILFIWFCSKGSIFLSKRERQSRNWTKLAVVDKVLVVQNLSDSLLCFVWPLSCYYKDHQHKQPQWAPPHGGAPEKG